MQLAELQKELGNIDLYLLDFLLKHPPSSDDRLLDLGCGEGRNSIFLLKNAYNCWGVDSNEEAIRFCRLFAKQYGYQELDARFQVQKIQQLMYPDASFAYGVAINILQHASTVEALRGMLAEIYRVIAKGGKLYVKMVCGLKNKRKDVDILHLPIEEIENELKHTGFEFLEPAKNISVLGVEDQFVAYLYKK